MRAQSTRQFSSMASGINRIVEDCTPTQVVDGVDVFQNDGALRRRDAWRSVAAGPVLPLPPGRAIIYTNSTLRANRTFDYTNIAGAGQYVYVGCTEQFDGFDISDIVTNSGGAVATSKRLVLEYWNGAWVTVPWFLDTTILLRSGDTFYESGGKNGKVHWHTQLLTGWTTQIIGTSPAAYYVRYKWQATNGVDVAPAQHWTISAPGITVFKRSPINGLFPLLSRGTGVILSMADSVPARGVSGGAALGAWYGGLRDTERLWLRLRYAAGIWGVHTFPNAIPRGAGATTTNAGTANQVTDRSRLDNTGGYLATQPYGSILASSITVLAGGTVLSFTSSFAQLLNFSNNAFEWCMLECQTNPAGGTPVAETRMVSRFRNLGGTVQFDVDDAFTIAPNASNTFRLIAPPNWVYIYSAGQRYMVNASAPATNRLPLEGTRPYAAHPADRLGADAVIHFEQQADPRWTVPGGEFWTSTVDPITGNTLLANGGAIYVYDGLSLEPLRVAPPDDPIVESMAGTLDSTETGFSQDPVALVNSQFLSQPPNGKFITNYGGILVVAGNPNDPNRVYWSAGHGASNIWPKVWNAKVWDESAEPITGLATLYDRLYVFTAKSVHEGTLASNGRIQFRPIGHGIGATCHRAIQRVVKNGQDVLMFPGPDGIYVLSGGGEPEAILDRWDRIVPGGINPKDLLQAPSFVMPQDGFYGLAVRGRNSARRNYIILVNYLQGGLWLWSMPFGVGSMAVSNLSSGREELLVGTEDGLIATLVKGETDDSVAVNGYAQTPPLMLANSQIAEPSLVNLTMQALGVGQGVDVAIFLDRSNISWNGGTVYPDIGETSYGIGRYGTDLWASEADVTLSLGLPQETQARSVALRISGQHQWTFRRADVEFGLMSAAPDGG